MNWLLVVDDGRLVFLSVDSWHITEAISSDKCGSFLDFVGMSEFTRRFTSLWRRIDQPGDGPSVSNVIGNPSRYR